MRHRPRVLSRHCPPSSRSTTGVVLIACAVLLPLAGCDVGGSILVPRRDASVGDVVATDIVSTDVADVPGVDVTAIDARTDAPPDAAPDAAPTDVAPDTGLDAGGDVQDEGPVDSSVLVPIACGLGETDCSGTCRNLVMDPNHCGACGRACGAGQVCSDATCATVCSVPSTRCGAECVLLGDNERHCGACDHACAATETCSGGVCTPPASASANGCADGTREAFADMSMFPDIAACAGGFSVPGVFPAPVRVGGASCADSGNSAVSNVNGAGCSAADLCAHGWHICRGGEVGPATGGRSCAATTFPVDHFYTAAVSGPGCYRCALLTNTVLTGCTSTSCAVGCRERNDLNNDIFGCGAGRASVDCELTVTAGDRCVDVPGSTWTCPSDTGESLSVTKAEAAGGGVLCCRG